MHRQSSSVPTKMSTAVITSTHFSVVFGSDYFFTQVPQDGLVNALARGKVR
jgi:hypothetical protein